MAVTLTEAPVDAQLGTSLAAVVPAPASGAHKRVALTLCNITATDATVDLSRYDGTSDRYILKTVTVAVGKPVVLTDIILAPGFSLRARASAATTIDLTSDVVTRTVT